MQLALDLLLETQPSLSNFVVGANAEVLAQLQTPSQPTVYLWGEPASGKSHLLQALCAKDIQTRGCYLNAKELPTADFTQLPAVIAVDDLEQITSACLDTLFALQNRVRQSGSSTLYIASRLAPKAMSKHLGARDDVASRLAWGLTLKLTELSDVDKATAIGRFLAERGTEVSADVIPYLLTHHSRSIKDLAKLADSVDRFAFLQKRALTLPLLKQYLANTTTV
jgi:DnaA-homolog protein